MADLGRKRKQINALDGSERNRNEPVGESADDEGAPIGPMSPRAAPHLNADSRRISPEGLVPEGAPDQRILLWTRGELNP